MGLFPALDIGNHLIRLLDIGEQLCSLFYVIGILIRMVFELARLRIA